MIDEHTFAEHTLTHTCHSNTKGVTSETEVTYLITCADIWVSSARTEKNRTVRGCSSYQCYKNAQENCYLFSIEYFYKRKCVQFPHGSSDELFADGKSNPDTKYQPRIKRLGRKFMDKP